MMLIDGKIVIAQRICVKLAERDEEQGARSSYENTRRRQAPQIVARSVEF